MSESPLCDIFALKIADLSTCRVTRFDYRRESDQSRARALIHKESNRGNKSEILHENYQHK